MKAEERTRALGGGTGLLRRVSRLIDAAVTVDFNIGEEPGSLALAAISVPAIAQMLRDATHLLQDVRECFETDQVEVGGEGGDPDSLDGIGAMISAEVAAQEISDLAFLTRSQIRVSLSRLEAAVASQDPLQMVTRADDAARRLRRGLIPLESALGEYVGVAPPIRVWWDLEISLRIRSLYTALRRRVVQEPEPEDGRLRERLDSLTRHLADLRSSEIYRFLRIDDRIQLRVLYKRVVLWLNDDSGRDLVAGRRLWQDLTSFVRLLAGVNNRQELQEHDRIVVERACRVLGETAPDPDVLPGELLPELENLLGRDEELDELIEHPNEHVADEWLPVLQRLSRSLTGD